MYIQLKCRVNVISVSALKLTLMRYRSCMPRISIRTSYIHGPISLYTPSTKNYSNVFTDFST